MASRPWRFDLDCADRRGHSGVRSRQLLPDFIGGEGRAPGGERNQVEAAQGLDAVAAIVVEMALFLRQDTALRAGEQAHREVIGQRACGKKDSLLFA